MIETIKSFKRPIFFILAIAIIYPAYTMHYSNRHLNPSWDGYRIADFVVYKNSVEKWNQKKDIYEFTEFGNSFTYSPTIAFIFSKTVLNTDFKSAIIQWQKVNFIALLLCFLLGFLILKAAHPNIKIPWYLFLITFILTARFFNRDLNNGQVNIILLACFLSGTLALLKHKNIFAGIAFSFILCVKPFLMAFFFLYFLCSKQLKVLIASIASYVLLLLLPAVNIGLESTVGYLSGYWDFLFVRAKGDPYLLDPTKNQALVTLVGQIPLTIFQNKMVLFMITYTTGALIFIFAYFKMSLPSFSNETLKKIFFLRLCFLLTLIFSLATWKEYFMFLFLPYLFFLLRFEMEKKLLKTTTLLYIFTLFLLSVIKMPYFNVLIAIILAHDLISTYQLKGRTA